MDGRSAAGGLSVIVCTFLSVPALAVAGAALSVTVTTVRGGALAGAVVVAEPLQHAEQLQHAASARAARAAGSAGGGSGAGTRAVMDQRDLQFVPDVLIVQTGTAVEFPNSDNVRHQVYSFASAKTFQLPLYKNGTHPQVLFDRPGLVTLGCNIHDGMVGYIYVTDSPWYGRTDLSGGLQLAGLAAGDYDVRVWHPLMSETEAALITRVHIDDAQPASVHVQLRHALRTPLSQRGTDKQWADY